MAGFTLQDAPDYIRIVRARLAVSSTKVGAVTLPEVPERIAALFCRAIGPEIETFIL